MSEKFDVPPEHSRILTSPYMMPSQPWTKIIMAFAAGLACAMLVITATFVWPKGNSDSAKITAESSRVAQSKKASPAPSAAKTSSEISAQREEPRPAETTANADAANPTTAAAASEPAAQEDPCARETWPYVSQNCAGKQRTRNVRVIPTDRTAPPTVVTAAPEVAPRATDGAATPQTSLALVPPAAPSEQAPAPSAPAPASNAPAPSAPAPSASAPSEQVATQNATTPAVEPEVPMPKAKPDTIARTEPATTGSAPAIETERQAPVAAAPAQDSRSTRKSRDRRDRQDSRTSTRRDTARANPERIDDMRGGPDETRATRSRGAQEPATRQEPTTRQEQTTRSTRSRTIQIDDDVPTTRSSRARDERREGRDERRESRDERREGRDERRDERRIVIERPAEQERSYAREEKPRLPFPFFFFGNND